MTYDAKPVRISFENNALFWKAEACWNMRRREKERQEAIMITTTERMRLMQAQLAKCEEAREAAELRANHAVVLLARERQRLVFAVGTLRAVEANTWSPTRVHEIVVHALQEIGSP